MGNAAMVCIGRGERDAVTVLQADGNVMSLYSRVRVVDLILENPNHFVCHSSSLVLLHHGKILPLHTLLVPGEVYFLIPMPGHGHGADHHSHDEEAEYSDTSSLLHVEAPRRAVHRTGSMKFVISTEQLAKIMAGSIKGARRSAANSRLHQSLSRVVRVSAVQKMPQPWRPALSSIEEVAAT